MTESLKPDFHAKPYCLTHREIHTKGGANSGSIRAEEACLWCYSESDVLAEREHYEKQIDYLNRQLNLHIDTGDRMIKRAEAAEAESLVAANKLAVAEKKLAEQNVKIRKWYDICKQFPHKTPVSLCDFCNIVCMEMHEVIYDDKRV